jgi:hypothetical protein
LHPTTQFGEVLEDRFARFAADVRAVISGKADFAWWGAGNRRIFDARFPSFAKPSVPVEVME